MQRTNYNRGLCLAVAETPEEWDLAVKLASENGVALVPSYEYQALAMRDSQFDYLQSLLKKNKPVDSPQT